MAKITGIGGVFFKCDDPKSMKEWYAKNLGMPLGQWGTTFEWIQQDDPSKTGSTTWSLFPQTAKNFDPSTKPFMINYRVDDLAGMLAELKKTGVEVVDEVAEYDFGKFVHIIDPEGNIVELWEPID